MKIFKFLFKIVGIVLALVLILSVTLVFLLYDANKINTEYDEYSNDLNYEITSTLSCAIKDTSTTSIIDCSLEEDRVNYLLKALTNTLNKELQGKINITSANISINEDNISIITIYIKVFGFPSSIKGNFTLKEENNCIVLQINNANIGKISASKQIMGQIAKNIISSDDIESALNEKGIKISFKVEELKVSINKSDLPSMFDNILKDDPNKDLYSTLISILTKNDLVKIVGTNHEIGVNAYLESLAYNETSFYEQPYSYDYNNIRNKTESLLNANIITYENCGKVFDYLVRGYTKVTKNDEEGQYDFIKELDLSSIGINDPTTYEGILPSSTSTTIKQILENQTPSLSDLFNTSLDLKIYESDFDNILFGTGVIGISYAFARKEDNIYKVSYLYVESLYTHITNNTLEIIITLNINGYSLALKCNAQAKGSNGLSINCDVNSVIFGTISLENTEIKSILSYLSKILQDESWINVSADNLEISFNFVQLLTDNKILNTLVSKSTSTSVGLYTSSPDGYIKISLSWL